MASILSRDTKVPTSKDIIQFAKDHRVSLTAGDYRLQADQKISVGMLAGARITVREQAPVTLLIPAVKRLVLPGE